MAKTVLNIRKMKNGKGIPATLKSFNQEFRRKEIGTLSLYCSVSIIVFNPKAFTTMSSPWMGEY